LKQIAQLTFLTITTGVWLPVIMHYRGYVDTCSIQAMFATVKLYIFSPSSSCHLSLHCYLTTLYNVTTYTVHRLIYLPVQLHASADPLCLANDHTSVPA